jgi:serine/threonine-protein kinase
MYLVTELLEGRSLDELLAVPLSAERTLRVMMEVCVALDEAHGLGIIHRDLKPPNIFVLGATERVKVLDFGVANILPTELRSTHSIPTQLTDDGCIVGTPGYMSPEQVRALPLDLRSDLYSLGVVGYHCLAGRPPFVGSSGKVAVAHASLPPPRFANLENPVTVDPEVERLVMRLLEKSPDLRPASARILHDEIAAIIGSPEGSEGSRRRWWKLW